MSIPYYVEFGGGLGDVFYQIYTWGQYRALERLTPEERATVVLVSHNPHVEELFRWHPKQEQLTVRSVGYWDCGEDKVKRREHGLPPFGGQKFYALPSYRDEGRMPFYVSGEDCTVLESIERAADRFLGHQSLRDDVSEGKRGSGIVVFSVSAGESERDIPPDIVTEVVEAVLASGRLPVFVGRNYERHGRREVVPTATIRLPAARAALSRAAVAAVTSPHSACIRWAAVSSAFTGRNVPGPTCSVTVSVPTPRSRSCCRRSGVKWRPAVGAATAPSFRAKTVW